jgi:hypothetical protein
MKKIQLFIILLVCISSIYSLTEPYFIASNKIRSDVNNLNNMDISIDKVTSTGIVVYVNESQRDNLIKNGYYPIQMFNEARAYKHNPESKTYQYYTYDEYVSFMNDIADNYADICSLYVAGTSVQNRQILFIKISQNPSQNNAKPKVKLTSTIHGDEVVGYDLMIRLIQYLTSEYGIDEEITQLVDNTEIWINPLTNPDGYIAQERQNANGVDLNRHFPNFLTDDNNTFEGRETEIVTLMQFALDNKIQLSANFHGGAQVINYPWDTTLTLFPDDDLIRSLSLSYASLNPDLYYSTEFEDGITNGAQWYIIYGSLQDWDNYYNQVFHITAEISNNKWPNPNTLDNFWNNNKNSLINYIKQAQRGFSGVVKNSENQILPAKIELQDHLTIYNDAETGYFNRLVLPGTYNFLISSYGYEPVLVENVQITNEQGVFSEITLNSLPLTNLYGYVFDNNNEPLPNVRIEFKDTPVPVIYTDQNGYYNIPQISYGTYDVSVNYQDTNYIFTVEIYEDNYNIDFNISEPEFIEDFEMQNNEWVLQGTWNYQNIDNNIVLSDSPGNYQDMQDITATLNTNFSIPINAPANVGFNTKYAIEADYDYVYFEIYHNNQWQILDTFTGTSDWINKSYVLNQYSDSDVKFRFRLNSDYSENEDGIYIDNFYINTGSYYVDIIDETVVANNDLPKISHYPNPVSFNSAVNFKFDKTLSDDIEISIYNIKGQKVANLKVNKNSKNLKYDLNSNSQLIKLSSGIYLYRFKMNDKISNTQKMLIIK